MLFRDIGIGEAITPRANTFERSCAHQARKNLRMHSDGRRVARPNDSTSTGQSKNAISCVLATMWYSACCHMQV